MRHHDVRTTGMFSTARELICYFMRLLFRLPQWEISENNPLPLLQGQSL